MIGAGQLARMTQRAAIDLAVRLEVLAATPEDPAVLIGAPYRIGSPLEEAAVVGFAEGNDVVTLDHELVSNEALQRIHEAGTSVVPDPEALRYAQDKLYAETFRGAAHVGKIQDEARGLVAAVVGEAA